MRSIDARVIGGVLLVGFGFLFFLQSLGILQPYGWAFLWGVLLGVAGLLFLYVFLRDRDQWWAIFPAMPLLGAGLLLLLQSILPSEAMVFGGAVFLGLVSLSFWLVYLQRREFWWAIIPGGVIATTAVIALMSTILPAAETTALLFLGIGLTFLSLTLLPEGRGRQPWGVIPGGILIVMAALTGLAFGTTARLFWPLVFIAGGLILILRSRGRSASG